jgi:hypothetical protein
MRDLFDDFGQSDRAAANSHRSTPATAREVARYDYSGRDGETISTKIRLEPKLFRWTDGNPNVLYGLPEVVEADHVWINEGEKAADRMASALPPGHAATCAPTPAWDESFTQALIGKSVTIVVDRDDSGIKQARKAFESLRAAGIDVRCVQAAVTTDKADAFDHFEAGFVLNDFVPFDLDANEPADSETSTESIPRRTWPFFLGGNSDGSAEHRFAVDDLIHESSMVMIYGPQGSLKTQLDFDISAHIGLGIPYQGMPTTQGCSIYVCGEGRGGIEKRISAVYSEHPDLPDDAIVAIPSPVNLLDATVVADFAEFIATVVMPKLSMPVRKVTYDTMAKAMPGQSDSADDAISALESEARMIAARIGQANSDGFVPASVFPHHPRKNDGNYRGSGAIEGNFDTILKVTKTDAPRLEDRFFEISLDKVKDGPTERSWAYRASLVHVGTTDSGKENYAPVVRYLTDSEIIASRVSATTAGKTLSPAVKHLVELVVRIQGRDGKKPVPREVLAASGYIDAITAKSWDSKVPVHGIPTTSLQEAFYAEDSDVRTPKDGLRMVSEAVRKRWERRRDALINSGVAWVYDGWVWLAADADRTGADGE